MRYSSKREIILETVRANRIHPTAEEVYALVHPEHPEISMGTVYRNLNQLADTGSLLKLSMADGPDRYDGTVQLHHHAYCRCCGKVQDFDYDVGAIEKAVSGQTGIRADRCSINIRGLCCQCADKIKNKNDQKNEIGGM